MKKKTYITLMTTILLSTTLTSIVHVNADLKDTFQISSYDVKPNQKKVNTPNFTSFGETNTGTAISNPESYYFISSNPANSGDLEITGSCSKVGNYNVTAYDMEQQGVLIGDKVQASLGKFAIKTYHPLKQGTEILLVLRQGDTYLAQTKLIVGGDNEGFPAPIVDQPVYEGDTFIKGTGYKAGDTIVITNSTHDEIGRGKVDSNLTFLVSILPQTAYSSIYVIETDGEQTSSAAEVIVHEPQASSDRITSVDDYSLSGDGFIYGTYSGDKAAKVNITINGVSSPAYPIKPGKGQFEYYIKDLVTSAQAIVQVNLLDSNNNVLDSRFLNIIK